jgi:hypothetical protein
MSDQRLFGRSTCSALVITCSDFRFKSAEQVLVDAAGLRDDYDLIARPGAIRSLVLPRNAADGASMEDEIRLLWTLHRFTRVLMVNHVSCRAYDDVTTEQNERDVHTGHLVAAGALIEQRLDGVTAEAYLIEPEDGRLVCRGIPIDASHAAN